MIFCWHDGTILGCLGYFGFRLAASSRILLGACGAGLAWSAFMEKGSVLVELLPFMQQLSRQLCRVAPGETVAWDQTPMYAYGGLSKITEMHHVCIIGLPGPNQDRSQSLGMDLNTWVSSNIYVNISAVNATLRKALRMRKKVGKDGPRFKNEVSLEAAIYWLISLWMKGIYPEIHHWWHIVFRKCRELHIFGWNQLLL